MAEHINAAGDTTPGSAEGRPRLVPLHAEEPAAATSPQARRGFVRSKERMVWEHVSRSPLSSMWDLQGVPLKEVANCTWKSANDDSIFGRASQLAYSFFSAIFPGLIAVSALMGMVAQSSGHLYITMLTKLGALLPPAAFQIVLQTVQQTTKASTAGKVSFGLLFALISASFGVSAVQSTLDTVYKVTETRPFWKQQVEAVGITLLVAIIILLSVSVLLAGGIAAAWLHHHRMVGAALAVMMQVAAWTIAGMLMVLAFQCLYYFCPDLKARRWHWFTPGALVGLLGWVIGSVGLRIYLHFFNTYSATYGSLGAVIILLLWFYITGLMILLGGEVNSEIEHAVAKRQIETGAVKPVTSASTGEAQHPTAA